MTEWQKAQAGYMFDAIFDKEIVDMRDKCMELCREYNNCKPSEKEKKNEILHKMLGHIEGDISVMPPFHCDYGFNISVGKNFYCNFNCAILDSAKVTFGDNVFIAPNCVFSPAGHAIDRELRAKGYEIALPITVGDDVWFGANVTVLPGVTIGSGTIIGASSVVTKDIPSGVIAGGNPCRVLREITEKDKNKYPFFEE